MRQCIHGFNNMLPWGHYIPLTGCAVILRPSISFPLLRIGLKHSLNPLNAARQFRVGGGFYLWYPTNWFSVSRGFPHG